MSSLRLALAQLNLTVGDLVGNRARIEAAIRQATAWLADVVIVPELAVTGYPPEDLLLKPAFVADNLAALEALVPSTRGITAIVGYVDRDHAGRLANAAAVLSGGRWITTYHKQCLPNYGVFDEKRYFRSGIRPVVLALGGWRIGVTICEDLWEPWPCQVLAEASAQIVVNLSASPYHAGKLAARESLFGRRARASRCAIASCNLVGGQDELVFDGASVILDAQGRKLARAAQFREDLMIVDLSDDTLRRAPAARGPVRAITVPTLWRDRPRLPDSIRMAPNVLGPIEEIYEALALGLRDYVRKNGFTTVVLGLSGGVDSALTACLAVDALGAAQVKALVMPSRYSSSATQADAKRLARALRIDALEVSIEPVFRAYLNTLTPACGGRPAEVTAQNLQARIRGNLLMALSNTFGWLVLTTGNKSEIATGYTTLYGDMAGGFALIKDVPKTLVYQLARHRNRRSARAPIPSRILRRAPSAELAPHQTDQDTLPPYAVLDRILKAYVEEDQTVPQIIAGQRAAATTVQRVMRMVDRAEYKRRQGPPGIKITPRAFGKDRRMPITNRYRES